MISCFFFFFIFLIATLFIYFWLCWVPGSREGFLQPRQAGATPHRGAGTALHRGARAPPHRGPPRRGAQAPDAQAQQSWPTGPAAPRHAGSPQTRARTRAPRIGRQTPNHCATREAPSIMFLRFIHIVESIDTLFHLLPNSIPLYWVDQYRNVTMCLGVQGT